MVVFEGWVWLGDFRSKTERPTQNFDPGQCSFKLSLLYLNQYLSKSDCPQNIILMKATEASQINPGLKNISLRALNIFQILLNFPDTHFLRTDTGHTVPVSVLRQLREFPPPSYV